MFFVSLRLAVTVVALPNRSCGWFFELWTESLWRQNPGWLQCCLSQLLFSPRMEVSDLLSCWEVLLFDLWRGWKVWSGWSWNSIYFSCCTLLTLVVIYKRVVARKIRLTRRFSFISFIEINKINQRMEYLSRLTGRYLVDGKRLLCRVTLSETAGDSTARVTSACHIYIFPTTDTGYRKHYLWKKKWLVEKKTFFFYNWEFSGDRVCAEAMLFSVWHLSLLGQLLSNVDVCQSVFCVF